VIVDFGGSNAALGKFVDLIQKKEKLQGAGSVVIYVGQEEKVPLVHLINQADN